MYSAALCVQEVRGVQGMPQCREGFFYFARDTVPQAPETLGTETSPLQGTGKVAKLDASENKMEVSSPIIT